MNDKARKSYILQYKAKRRLHQRAYKSQQYDQGEVCGIVLSDKLRSLELVFLPNRSQGSWHFEIALDDIRITRRDAQSQGKRFIGIFHSHIAGEAILSKSDLERGRVSHLQLIYDICGRQLRMWRIKKKEGRRFAVEVPIEIEYT